MKKILLFIALAFSLGMASPIGDRLIVSINNLSYSQRQIEVYFYIKEAVREQPTNQEIEISQSNWPEVQKVFVEDMIVLQEAVRLGSFQINDTALEKYTQIVSSQLAKNESLKNNFSRLGIGKKSLTSELENVLRVAGFRKSKRRQNRMETADTLEDLSKQKWLIELTDRAVTRTYEGSQNYILIQPNQGQAIDDAI